MNEHFLWMFAGYVLGYVLASLMRKREKWCGK